MGVAPFVSGAFGLIDEAGEFLYIGSVLAVSV